MRLKKRLGQHFLIRQEVAESITALAEIKPSEVVVEIGAGTGILTRALAKRAKKVITFEVDPDLIPT
ncbi:MAG: ribosomal RNA small subunit methyltransferase A, partial [bacterium (Candidatus Ratteibacteria) CG23_combo_of_CG06-09_8_20_14_all_48_7]